MSDTIEPNAEQAAAFQKMWLDTISRLMQAAFTGAPNSPPPEMVRQIRSGIFQAENPIDRRCAEVAVPWVGVGLKPNECLVVLRFQH